MTMLQVENLTKSYDGVKALDNFSFEFNEKEIVALVGSNGSGKTTFFHIVSGFLSSDSGRVSFKGKNISGLTPDQIVHRGIARTFQDTKLFSQISVLDNVMLGLKGEKGDGFFDALFQTKRMKDVEERNRKTAENLLTFVSLADKKNVLAYEMSHGQRKLLELARILALDPEMFLLDEPLAGLFDEKKIQMLNHIKTLKERGKTILLIEHDLRSVLDVADRIIVLDHGRRMQAPELEMYVKGFFNLLPDKKDIFKKFFYD